MGSPIVHHLALPQTAAQRKKLSDGEVEGFFVDWYRHYPRKVARRTALKAYRAAINRGHTSFELQRGARRYAAEVASTPKDRIKHPSTWLNGDCWLDEALPQRSAVGEDLDGRSPRYVLERDLFKARGPDFTRHFTAYLLDASVRLRLTPDRTALARSLAALYLRVEAERKHHHFEVQDYEMLMGDSALLRQYIEWVGEQGWHTASLNVLQFDSPAFGQFRREQALADQFGRDPITKHSRYSVL